VKFTRENLKAIIKEELNKIIDEGMPVGDASPVEVEGPTQIFQDGTFSLDVSVSQWKSDGPAPRIFGQLDEDSIALLYELGILKEELPESPPALDEV